MKTHQIWLTEYWAKQQLLTQLVIVNGKARNARTALILDIDLCDSAETDLMLSEIERQFAYLEAGLCARSEPNSDYFKLFSFPVLEEWENIVIDEGWAVSYR